MESEIRKAINSVGLDYSIGFLHEINQSRTPLVYDIQELFRWLIDVSVIQFLEEKKVKKSDFIITENYHTRLRENTAKMLIEKINLNFSNKKPYKKNKNYSYHVILQDITQQLANYIIGKTKECNLTIPKINLGNLDYVKISKKVMSLNPQERKRLGINKSTLWHIKKNIKQKKKINIHNKTLEKMV